MVCKHTDWCVAWLLAAAVVLDPLLTPRRSYVHSGATKFDNDEIRTVIAKRLGSEAGQLANDMDFLPIVESVEPSTALLLHVCMRPADQLAYISGPSCSAPSPLQSPMSPSCADAPSSLRRSASPVGSTRSRRARSRRSSTEGRRVLASVVPFAAVRTAARPGSRFFIPCPFVSLRGS